MAFNKRETWTFEELLAETGQLLGLDLKIVQKQFL